jgi:hypothetical protein
VVVFDVGEEVGLLIGLEVGPRVGLLVGLEVGPLVVLEQNSGVDLAMSWVLCSVMYSVM